MEDKKALEILMAMKGKYPLTSEEEEALSNAVGILSWTSLAESRLKKLKDKRKKEKEGE